MREIITEHMMVITLPRGVQLWLGKDLNTDFPPSLEHIMNGDLLALLKQIDPTPDSLRGTGMVDWADLAQRIHFIAAMFRCYQESQDLFEPPFASEQVTALQAGLLPAGKL